MFYKLKNHYPSSVQFSRSVMSDSLWPYQLQHARPLCPSPSPGVHTNPCPLSWWCHLTISFSVTTFSSCLQSFPASGSFPVSQLFTLGGQSIGASASVLPMNTQDWFPLGLIRLISLQSKGFSGVFSSTTIQKHQFISAQPEIGQGRMRNADFCLLQEDSPLIAAGVRRSSVFLAVTDEQSFHLTELGEGMNMDFGSKCFNRFYWILVYFLE